jgi:hypothetical protein
MLKVDAEIETIERAEIWRIKGSAGVRTRVLELELLE